MKTIGFSVASVNMTIIARARNDAMNSSCFPNSASDFYDTVLKSIMKGLVSKNIMKKTMLSRWVFPGSARGKKLSLNCVSKGVNLAFGQTWEQIKVIYWKKVVLFDDEPSTYNLT